MRCTNTLNHHEPKDGVRCFFTDQSKIFLVTFELKTFSCSSFNLISVVSDEELLRDLQNDVSQTSAYLIVAC